MEGVRYIRIEVDELLTGGSHLPVVLLDLGVPPVEEIILQDRVKYITDILAG